MMTNVASPTQGQLTRTALVAGATGAIGAALMQQLITSGVYGRIHCIGRRSVSDDQPSVRTHVVDFERLDQFEIDEPVDAVFCALGTTLQVAGSVAAFRRVDYDYVLQVGKLASRLNARSLSVVSSIGADVSARSLYLRTKGEMEQALTALELPRLGLFRPSLLRGSLQRSDFRAKEVISAAALSVLGPLCLYGRFRKYRSISPDRVARAMLTLSLDQELSVVIYESDVIELVANGERSSI